MAPTVGLAVGLIIGLSISFLVWAIRKLLKASKNKDKFGNKLGNLSMPGHILPATLTVSIDDRTEVRSLLVVVDDIDCKCGCTLVSTLFLISHLKAARYMSQFSGQTPVMFRFN